MSLHDLIYNYTCW